MHRLSGRRLADLVEERGKLVLSVDLHPAQMLEVQHRNRSSCAVSDAWIDFDAGVRSRAYKGRKLELRSDCGEGVTMTA
jgi:hypothetical protein